MCPLPDRRSRRWWGIRPCGTSARNTSRIAFAWRWPRPTGCRLPCPTLTGARRSARKSTWPRWVSRRRVLRCRSRRHSGPDPEVGSGNCPFGEQGRARRVLAVVWFVLAPAAAAWSATGPPDVADPDRFQCVGRNHFSGKVDIPVEKHDAAASWSYAAFFVDPVHGTSLIVYGPSALPRSRRALMQAFIRRHECQASQRCARRDRGQLQRVGADARRAGPRDTSPRGATRNVGIWTKSSWNPQYGGSSTRFWEHSVRCAARMR